MSVEENLAEAFLETADKWGYKVIAKGEYQGMIDRILGAELAGSKFDAPVTLAKGEAEWLAVLVDHWLNGTEMPFRSAKGPSEVVALRDRLLGRTATTPTEGAGS